MQKDFMIYFYRTYHMRRVAIGLLIFLTSTFGQACIAANLSVVVSGVKNANGNVAIALFSASQGFPKDDSKAIRRVMAPIDSATHSAKAVFADVPPGHYAIAAFHDDNNTGKLETNFFGIPTKGYGFSNHVRPKMRAPTFDEARFDLPADQARITIELGY